MSHDEALKIEIPFEWTCPSCKHKQTDTVNPILGPFFSVICGECQAGFAEYELDPQDCDAFDLAVAKAEECYTEEKQQW
jgi:hypothetical protein